MMDTGKEYLYRFAQKWQCLHYIEAGLYALGAALLLGLFLASWSWGLATGLLVGVLSLVFLRPWQYTVQRSAAFVDAHLAEVHHSSTLLLQPIENLNGLARLQQFRAGQIVLEKGQQLHPPHRLKQAFFILVLFTLLGTGLARTGWLGPLTSPVTPEGQRIRFVPVLDSLSQDALIPKLVAQNIILTYPSYTGKGAWQGTEPNIKALEGTHIRWQLQFEGTVQSVFWESMGDTKTLQKTENGFMLGMILEASRFYSFRFLDAQGQSYVTELYAMEAIPDTEPTITLDALEQYVYFDWSQDKKIAVNAIITDDYGTSEAHIIATVSKGSGESVKFREEKLLFEQGMVPGAKSLALAKTIDLDALDMGVGDELYFYVEALDNKRLRPNISRSETYFAIVKDTATDAFAVEGTMGVDLMPDYFRSQRQLIIDTEKLLKEQPSLSEKEFKFRSNELGFDQKALRLKYGQFMGDESEMSMDTETAETPDVEADHDHDHEGEEEDPLAAYTHDHDGSNEHNLVPQEEGETEDPLHEYIHNHSDPEEATLFEESLKSKLRKALDIMWDAELHLRLYDPKKSLPYQYDALKLIQEIKNSARIYVHRIGFDPPPIKEEKRLTGDIKAVNNVQKISEQEFVTTYPNIRRAVARLEVLSQNNVLFTPTDATLFTAAGNELAALAVQEPGKHLGLLQRLKDLERTAHRTQKNYLEVEKGLMDLLPQIEPTPTGMDRVDDTVQELFLNALQGNE
jgi:hypothetical protein